MTTGRPGVPAWKRLGLKLKYANEVPERIYTNGLSVTETQVAQVTPEQPQPNASEPPKKKRKVERKPEPKGSSSTNPNGTAHHSVKALKKQVSFSADTKSAAPTANDDLAQVETTSEGSQPSTIGKKSKKKSAKSLQQPPARKSNAAIGYLDQYHSARSSWKFNKNRETWILKHVFSENDIPRDHNLGLAEYIHGLQGTGARERLKTQCVELLKKAKATESEDETNKDHSTRRDNYVQRLLDDLEKPATNSDNEDDREYKAWVRQQSRPTLLLWALGLDEQLLSNGTEPTSSAGAGHVNGVDAAAKAKKRKNRTAVVDYDSSSSSSGSSSDNESEEDEGDKKTSDCNALTTVEEDTSSSGSDEETSSSDSECASGADNS